MLLLLCGRASVTTGSALSCSGAFRCDPLTHVTYSIKVLTGTAARGPRRIVPVVKRLFEMLGAMLVNVRDLRSAAPVECAGAEAAGHELASADGRRLRKSVPVLHIGPTPLRLFQAPRSLSTEFGTSIAASASEQPRSRLRILLWAAALLPFLFLALWRLPDGPGIDADDYGQYLRHAQALAEGRSYSDIGYIWSRLRRVLARMDPDVPIAKARTADEIVLRSLARVTFVIQPCRLPTLLRPCWREAGIDARNVSGGHFGWTAVKRSLTQNCSPVKAAEVPRFRSAVDVPKLARMANGVTLTPDSQLRYSDLGT
jgi:hypothetical protein